jgi:hypothetical protein
MCRICLFVFAAGVVRMKKHHPQIKFTPANEPLDREDMQAAVSALVRCMAARLRAEHEAQQMTDENETVHCSDGDSDGNDEERSCD